MAFASWRHQSDMRPCYVWPSLPKVAALGVKFLFKVALLFSYQSFEELLKGSHE